MRFKRIFSILLLIFITQSLKSQIISVSQVILLTHTNQSSKMINSCEDFSHAGNPFVFGYEHLLKKSSILIYGRYYQFEGSTTIRFYEGAVIDIYGLGIDGIGYEGADIKKIDLGIKYNLVDWKSIFFVKLNSGIGFQQSVKNGYDFWSVPGEINGPDYVETTPLDAESRNTFQIMPTLGFECSFMAFKKIELSFMFQGFYGFVPYQSMYLDYTYKGVKQKTAVFDATGTGIYFGVGLGYKVF